MIDCTLPVAGKEDMTTFGSLFTTATRRRLTDSHLWVSVVSRPNRSNFTRVQRISCILSLIFTTMIANAMFYRSDDNVEQVHEISVGPLSFGVHQLWVSFASSMVVIPVNVLIDQLFRKSIPKPNKVDAKNENKSLFSKFKISAWTKNKEKHNDQSDDIGQKDVSTISRPLSIISDDDNDDNDDKDESVSLSRTSSPLSSITSTHMSDKSLIASRSQRKWSLSSKLSFLSNKDTVQDIEDKINGNVQKLENKRSKKKSLPYWCAYIAWFVCVVTVVTSAFFTFTYSLEWGKEKANKWLTAMLLSIVESVLLIQPTKVCTYISPCYFCLFYPSAFWALWGIVIISICLSVCLSTLLVNQCPYYAPWGSLEAY